MVCRLRADELRFYKVLHRVVTTNPFDPERERLDRDLLGPAWVADFHARTTAIQLRAARYAARLQADGRLDLAAFPTEERELLRYGLLYDLYVERLEDLEDLVLRQEAAPDRPCPVPFADGVLAALRQRGYDAEEARRYFALFFQIRRAFLFIDRALVGRGASMQATRRALWDNIFTGDVRRFDAVLRERMEDFSTLLLGETGTGKGAAAAAIGRSSFIPFDERRGTFAESFARAFVEVNLSQFAEGLIDAELFGHVKGAFTGAVDDAIGLFGSCSPYGAILLDEIGEIGAPLQIKLLRVLQERTFTPVGSRQPGRFEGRVIAATNRSLPSLRGPGGFRDDFYFRLSSDVIELPSLRRRLDEAPDELVELVQSVLHRMLGAEGEALVDEVHATILGDLGPAHPWPGNVRELEQCVRRILLRGHCRTTATAEPVRVLDPSDPWLQAVEQGTLDAAELTAGYCARLYAARGSFAEVARATRLDRRTVRKYVDQARR